MSARSFSRSEPRPRLEPTLAEPWVSEEEQLLAAIPDSPRLRRILSDLETLVLHEGFLHLSVGDLAVRLRCSKASLYRLAPNRDALIELVLRIWLARGYDAARRGQRAATDWPSRLRDFLWPGIAATEPVSYDFVRDRQSFPAALALRKEYQARFETDVAAIIRGGIEAGAFRPVNPVLAAHFIASSIADVTNPEFLAATGSSATDAYRQAWELWQHALIPNPERS